MGAVDVESGFGGGGTLAGVVAFVDNGKVKEIAAEREVKVVNGPSLECGGFQRGKVVDCDGYGFDCSWLVGCYMTEAKIVVLGFHEPRMVCVVLVSLVVSVEASLDETCVAIDRVKALGIVAGCDY